MDRRFIPAYAGFCEWQLYEDVKSEVHPRLRGVLSEHTILERREYGSSPLTRGSVNKPSRICMIRRFIPAYAGFCTDYLGNPTPEEVHPRLRGVLSGGTSGTTSSTGSSPLTRGSVVSESADVKKNRFIPAYAGFCFTGKAKDAASEVHPRLRGVLVLS